MRGRERGRARRGRPGTAGTAHHLLLVKVIYAMCVEDLKIVKGETKGEEAKNG
jgi:hypothetical protein